MGVWVRLCLLASLGLLLLCFNPTVGEDNSFKIEGDRFIKDGKPVQLISGSVHYQRIHPAYWRDRLQRVQSMGLNAIQVYVPWNVHEPFPGQYSFEGFANLPRFLGIAHDLGLLVLLRPGPYICAEWDFGGLPWWLASSKVAGGGKMALRNDDPDYLGHVDRWWRVLLGRLRPFMYEHGGNIVLVQVENEYGFCGDSKPYLRHLIATAKAALGDNIILYTTDPPDRIVRGSIPGDEVYTVVDFAPGTNLEWAFGTQRSFNPPGKSPPFCSEFYTGWLTHWGEKMANTSSDVLVRSLTDLLEYRNNSGSVNFYMAHGGTNFGYWAGANVNAADPLYQAHITSYDYDCPISEAGCTGQPGIGGVNKFQVLRDAILAHTGGEAPEPLAEPRIEGYGTVALDQQIPLLSVLDHLYPGGGLAVELPQPIEEYGQSAGLIVYRTHLRPDLLSVNSDNVLDVGGAVHDYAQVLLNGKLVGDLDRSHPRNLTLPPPTSPSASSAAQAGATVLEIVVQAVGRSNFGCTYDVKGLISPHVFINGEELRGWQVFPLPLDNLDAIPFDEPEALRAAGKLLAAQASSAVALKTAAEAGRAVDPQVDSVGPVFFRGTFNISSNALVTVGGSSFPADTYLSTPGWAKGLAWVNGFNLGWYWPSLGPQMTMYVPGPVLRQGENELLLLEMDAAPEGSEVELVDTPDFHGPAGKAAAADALPSDAEGPASFDRSRYMGRSPTSGRVPAAHAAVSSA